MKNTVKRLLAENGIEYCGVLGAGSFRVINPGLYRRSVADFAKCAAVFLVPYAAGGESERNVSLYAVPRDYHLFMKGLFDRVCAELGKAFPANRFYGMADHSPIDETLAAARAGLGAIGDNGRLINEKYGSYVFIGEIYTDAALETDEVEAVAECIHCGACRAACPAEFGVTCLSDITQRKGDLTPDEQAMMRAHGTAWGCDICQEVCPMNAGASPCGIAFFNEDRIAALSSGSLENMSEDDFRARAYSWRGRKVIERNIKILEAK